MSSPFSVASSSAGNPNNINSQGYQMPAGNFPYTRGYNGLSSSLHGNIRPPQTQSQPQAFYPPQLPTSTMLPPGKNDLEILEKLKEMIKNGQHEFYRAIPQPAALASLYLGPTAPSQSQVPHHPEQAPESVKEQSTTQTQASVKTAPSSPMDVGRRSSRLQNKDGWDVSNMRKSNVSETPQGNHAQIRQQSTGTLSSINSSILSNSNIDISGTHSTNLKTIHDTQHSMEVKTSSNQNATASSVPQRPAKYDSSTHSGPSTSNFNQPHDSSRPPDNFGITRSGLGDISVDKGAPFDGKDDGGRPIRDAHWTHRDGPPSLEDRNIELGSAFSNRLGVNVGNDNTRGPADRGVPALPPTRDEKFLDREKDDRDRDRDRPRRDWHYDRDRDRRSYDRIRDSRVTDMRRPPPEQRHYEPDYDRPPPHMRSYENKGHEDPPGLGGIRRMSDARPPGLEHKIVPPHTSDDNRISRAPADTRPPNDSHVPNARAPSLESRHVRAPSVDHNAMPVSGKERSGISFSDGRAIRPPVPVARPVDAPGAGPVKLNEDRDRVPPQQPSAHVEDRNTRIQVPPESRINHPTPPDSSPRRVLPVTDNERGNTITRQAGIEEREAPSIVSPLPVAGSTGRTVPPPSPDDSQPRSGSVSTDRDRVSRPGKTLEERSTRGGTIEPVAPPISPEERAGRHGDRYPRPTTPSPPNGNHPPLHRRTYPPRRSPSVMRDDTRNIRPPSPQRMPREYRPVGRDLSRERPDIRPGNYRPDADRPYHDDRRPDTMEVDESSARFADNRPPYRHFTPPSPADLARDRARQQQSFQPSPPRRVSSPIGGPPYDEHPRRYGNLEAGRGEWSYQFDSRRRDWNVSDDEYWKSRPQWERNNRSPQDRERFEREVHPLSRNHTWEPRTERDSRQPFARAPSPRSYDGPRSLSSRLTDGYPPHGPDIPDDRGYVHPLPSIRDGDRTRPHPTAIPPYSRVRQRSPSPARRTGLPIDDSRPPMKRQREDYPPQTEYYPPPPPHIRRQPVGEYPPRSGASSPLPGSTSGGSYYDRSAPPPPSSASTTASGPPPKREYVRERGPNGALGMDYTGPGPASYDRPRSPGPPRGGQGYGRGGYVPRERGYMPPPPPRTA